MNGKTHMAIGAAVSPLVVNSVEPNSFLFTVSLVILGSLMPDIDKENSKISTLFRKLLMAIVMGLLVVKAFPDIFMKFIPGITREFAHRQQLGLGVCLLICYLIIGKVSIHRTFTHSIIGTVVCCIGVFLLVNDALIPFGLGYILHLIADIITIEGVPLLYPIKTKFALKLFSTGSIIEMFISTTCIALFISLMYFKLN